MVHSSLDRQLLCEGSTAEGSDIQIIVFGDNKCIG